MLIYFYEDTHTYFILLKDFFPFPWNCLTHSLKI